MGFFPPYWNTADLFFGGLNISQATWLDSNHLVDFSNRFFLLLLLWLILTIKKSLNGLTNTTVIDREKLLVALVVQD